MITWAIVWLITHSETQGSVGAVLLFSMIADIIIFMCLAMCLAGIFGGAE